VSLEIQIRHIFDNFENTSSHEIIEILTQIKPKFKNQIISDYLQGKIQKILELNQEFEKKKQCKALIPYLDWYVQGI
jgi:thermostable 8-oxoguanine DNA glycosylase